MRRTLALVLILSASVVGLALARSHHGDTISGRPESGFAAQMMQAMRRVTWRVEPANDSAEAQKEAEFADSLPPR